jgi:lipid A 3-O-deacylase
MKSTLTCALFAMAAGHALADHQILWITGSKTWAILGSQDIRNGLSVHFQKVKPDKRLSFRQNRAEFVWEGYVQRSWGGRPGRGKNTQSNIGILALGRYEQGLPGTARSYWEAGWGLEWVDKDTQDLDSPINSAPTLGAGYIFPQGGKSELYLGFRYHHVSNGGTKRPNQGQNWIQLMLGVRF